MGKIYGQDLKKSYTEATLRKNNLENKINKRFDLIINSWSHYMTDADKTYVINSSMSSIDTQRKLDIIIRTEANYEQATGNQTDLFLTKNK